MGSDDGRTEQALDAPTAQADSVEVTAACPGVLPTIATEDDDDYRGDADGGRDFLVLEWCGKTASSRITD